MLLIKLVLLCFVFPHISTLPIFFCLKNCCFLCAFFVLSIQSQYQVPVVHGELLEQGKVAETCENVGMKAVCFGDEGCSHDKDSSR